MRSHEDRDSAGWTVVKGDLIRIDETEVIKDLRLSDRNRWRDL